MSEDDKPTEGATADTAEPKGGFDLEHAHGEAHIPHGGTETRAALIRLVLILVVGAVAAIVFNIVATVLVIMGLVASIVLHEFGHFVVAKKSGMKATEFFIGFGPRVWSFRRGETEYGLKALPLGGYVKILGMSSAEVVDEADEPRTYRQKPFHSRFAVAIAGSTVHMIIAFVLLIVLSAGLGQQIPSPVVGSFGGGESPAQAAGIMVGDRITAIDGRKVSNWSTDVPPYIRGHANQPIRFSLERNGEPMEITVTPKDLRDNPTPQQQQILAAADTSKPVGFVGLGQTGFDVKRVPIIEATTDSVTAMGRGLKIVFGKLTERFSPSGINNYAKIVANTSTDTPEQQADQRFLSPVGVGKVANDAAKSDVRNALGLVISLNLFIGVFNMIPLLPLDGGHVAIAIYEKLRSRKGKRHMVNHEKLIPITLAVLACYGVIVVSSLYLDITRPLPNLFQ